MRIVDKLLKITILFISLIIIAAIGYMGLQLLDIYNYDKVKQKRIFMEMPLQLFDKSGNKIVDNRYYKLIITKGKGKLNKETLNCYDLLREDNIPVLIAVQVKDVQKEMPKWKEFFKRLNQEPLFLKTPNIEQSTKYNIMFNKALLVSGYLKEKEDYNKLFYYLDNEKLIDNRNIFTQYGVPQDRPDNLKPIISKKIFAPISMDTDEKQINSRAKSAEKGFISYFKLSQEEQENEFLVVNTKAEDSKITLDKVLEKNIFKKLEDDITLETDIKDNESKKKSLLIQDLYEQIDELNKKEEENERRIVRIKELEEELKKSKQTINDLQEQLNNSMPPINNNVQSQINVQEQYRQHKNQDKNQQETQQKTQDQTVDQTVDPYTNPDIYTNKDKNFNRIQ